MVLVGEGVGVWMLVAVCVGVSVISVGGGSGVGGNGVVVNVDVAVRVAKGVRVGISGIYSCCPVINLEVVPMQFADCRLEIETPYARLKLKRVSPERTR